MNLSRNNISSNLDSNHGDPSRRTPMITPESSDALIDSASRFVCFDFDCTLTTTHWYYFLNDYDRWYENFGEESGISNEDGLKLSKSIAAKTYGWPIEEEWASGHLNNYNTLKNSGANEIEKVRNAHIMGKHSILISTFFGGLSRLQELDKSLQELRKKGTKIIILSRGAEAQIHFLLKLAKLRHHFDAIYGGEDNFEGWTKDMMIEKMLEKGKSVVYYDDDSGEHESITEWLGALDVDFTTDGDYYKAIMKPSGTIYCYYTKLVKNKQGLSTDIIEKIPGNVARLLGTNGGRRRKTHRRRHRKTKSRRSRK